MLGEPTAGGGVRDSPGSLWQVGPQEEEEGKKKKPEAAASPDSAGLPPTRGLHTQVGLQEEGTHASAHGCPCTHALLGQVQRLEPPTCDAGP